MHRVAVDLELKKLGSHEPIIVAQAKIIGKREAGADGIKNKESRISNQESRIRGVTRA